MRKKVYVLLAVLLAALIVGCNRQAAPDEPQTVEVEVEVVVTATPKPTLTATPDPMDQELSDMTVGELLDLVGEVQAGGVQTPTASLTGSQNITSVVDTQWFTATNVPAEVETIKQNPSGCNMPDAVCYMLDEEGVLGADDYEEAQANPSAVWTGGANHQTADQETAGVLIPEGSYVTAYASGFRIIGGGYELELPECGELCAWGFLARGWFAETRADRHVPVQITIGEPGGMKYTRYPVPVEAGQFFSEDYLTDQARNTLQFDNCGAEDCEVFLQAVFDYNDGSLSVLRFTGKDGWEVLWTNVQDPTQ
jgi:hypothetical protein